MLRGLSRPIHSNAAMAFQMPDVAPGMAPPPGMMPAAAATTPAVPTPMGPQVVNVDPTHLLQMMHMQMQQHQPQYQQQQQQIQNLIRHIQDMGNAQQHLLSRMRKGWWQGSSGSLSWQPAHHVCALRVTSRALCTGAQAQLLENFGTQPDSQEWRCSEQRHRVP